MEQIELKGGIARKALRYRSLFIFERDNKFRRACVKMLNNTFFEIGILVCIIVSSCLIDTPKTTPVIIVDMILNCIFLFELLAKVVACGLVMHPCSYLRDAVNVLDACIVVSGKLCYFPYLLPSSKHDSNG